MGRHSQCWVIDFFLLFFFGSGNIFSCGHTAPTLVMCGSHSTYSIKPWTLSWTETTLHCSSWHWHLSSERDLGLLSPSFGRGSRGIGGLQSLLPSPWKTRRRRGPVTGKTVNNCVCQHHRLPRAHCCLVKGGAAPPIKARWWCWWCHWFAAVCYVVSMAPGDRWMCVGYCYLEVWLDIYWEQPCWSGLKDDWGLCGSVEKTCSQVCGIPM